MGYLVYGAGAIGGGVGGLLHLAGHPVTLVARGEHLAAIRRDGLDLQVGHDRHRLDVATAAGAGEVTWSGDDVVLLAVKSQQTEAALADLLATMPVGTPVVSLQNGVSNERRLLRHVEHVHGVCVMMPASHLTPGRVIVHSAGAPALLDIGRYPSGHDAVDTRVAADLGSTGIDSVPRADIMAWKHRKLIMNLANAIGAACPSGADADRLMELVQDEGEQVLAAAGIAVTSEAADLERRGELLRPLVDRTPDGGGSTWQSVRRGTGNVEVDHLNGEIVLLGRLHGVPTPANELVRQTCLTLVRNGAAPRSVDAGGLLDHLGRRRTHEGPLTTR